LLVIRNGFQIYGGENIDSVHNIWSCSKTFTSNVLGLLVDDEKVKLDDRPVEYEPLLEQFYDEVRFRHFTTMTSGYSAAGDSRWEDTDYADWSWTWYPEKEVNGIPINNGCTNVFVNAKQLARWGRLFLHEGNWDGNQLISKEWVREATSVQVPADLPVADTDRKDTKGSGCYGFNWWVNGKLVDGKLKLPGAPERCYFASGLNNNKCIVIPGWNMVVIRMGRDGHPEEADKVYGEFLRLLGEAIES
jgi:CubicO group peptidase (beta-lactamase class C family)